MVLTIHVSPELERQLHDAAAAEGEAPEEYVEKILAEHLAHSPDSAQTQSTTDMPTTPAEMVAYWEKEGLFGLFAEGPDSPELARQLRRQADIGGGW